MGDLEDFRTDFLGRQTQAEEALVHGDVEPRLALWSRRDPVTLLGGWVPNKTGWAELERKFRWVAQRLWRRELHGQMAYTVGSERFNEILADGGKKPWTVRVTHAYRREDGEWKIVHRHGDLAPIDESPPASG